MEDIISQFRKIAPYIASSVREKIADEMTEEEVMSVIHKDIVSHFNNQQRMMSEYLSFNADQRAAFGGVMYELIAPLAENIKPSMNPLYEDYVRRTGKTGARNFMTNA